jgi:hypothetical protein
MGYLAENSPQEDFDKLDDKVLEKKVIPTISNQATDKKQFSTIKT